MIYKLKIKLYELKELIGERLLKFFKCLINKNFQLYIIILKRVTSLKSNIFKVG